MKQRKKYEDRTVELTKKQRANLEELFDEPGVSKRVRARAHVLLLSEKGWERDVIATAAQTSVSTVGRVRSDFCDHGLEAALTEKPRPGVPRSLSKGEEQRVVALACTDPPTGYSRWTVRLLCTETARRKLIPKVSRETVRIILKEHDTKPWREKNVVYPEVGR